MRALLSGAVIALLAFTFTASAPSAFAQGPTPKGSLLQGISRQLESLTPLERITVLKIAENKITDHVQEMIRFDDSDKNRFWTMKIIAISYGFLTFIWEDYYPDIGAIYRERADFYSDLVRGKRRDVAAAAEAENEKKKNAALQKLLHELMPTQKDLSQERGKFITDMGNELGLTIAAHGKIIASKTQPDDEKK